MSFAAPGGGGFLGLNLAFSIKKPPRAVFAFVQDKIRRSARKANVSLLIAWVEVQKN